jgi:type II secretory pathway pseudopilin PulG
MKRQIRLRGLPCGAFSLVEVVLALGVISFAIVAILGVFPIGLSTSHSAQDETRAPQIAQTIFATLAGQTFGTISLKLYNADGTANGSVDMDLTQQTGTDPNLNGLSANNSGDVFILTAGNPAKFFSVHSPPSLPATDATPVYAITALFNNAPTGFDAQFANEVTITVAWPAGAAAANQTKRSYTRIISKY